MKDKILENSKTALDLEIQKYGIANDSDDSDAFYKIVKKSMEELNVDCEEEIELYDECVQELLEYAKTNYNMIYENDLKNGCEIYYYSKDVYFEDMYSFKKYMFEKYRYFENDLDTTIN